MADLNVPAQIQNVNISESFNVDIVNILLPQATDPLSLPDHAQSHRIFAHDSQSPDQSVAADSVGNVSILGNVSGANLSGINTGDQDLSSYQKGLVLTSVKTSNYTANPNEFVPCDISGGGFQVKLPFAPADGTRIVVKVITVGTNAVLQFSTQGADVFTKSGGNTSLYMTLSGETNTVEYKASSNVWYIISTAAPSNFAIGFPGVDAVTPIGAADISINYTSRVLTIVPPLGYFNVYTDGGGVITRMRKTGTQTFPAFTDTSGVWYFYYDITGNPTVSQTEPDALLSTTIYALNWNSTLAGSAKSVTEVLQTHQNTVPIASRDWTKAYGVVWQKGFSNTNNLLPSGSPNADGRNTCFSLTTGTNMDDNLYYTITNSTGGLQFQQDLGQTNPTLLTLSNGGLFPIRYQDSIGQPLVLSATRFPFDFDSGTNLPQYITGAGVRTPVTNTYFFVYYVYAIQDPRNGQSIRIISDGSQYTSLTNAQASTWATITTLYPTLIDEIRPLYKLTFEYRIAYNIAVKKTALREVVDYRKSIISQATSAGGSIAASSVTVIPTATLLSTNQQAADAELDANKVPYTGSIKDEDKGIYNLKAATVTSKSAPTFTYTTGSLTGITYANGLTKVLTYNGDGTWHQTVITFPDTTTITKTGVYTGGVLTSVTVV